MSKHDPKVTLRQVATVEQMPKDLDAGEKE